MLAAGANRFLATAAVIGARVAAERVAPSAGAQAFAAEQVAAAVACVLVIVADNVSAVGAGAAVPIRERDVGTAGVVGVEDPAHDLEEVEQPSCSEGSIDGDSSVSFAELFSLDVRVRGLARFPRGVGFACDDLVGTSLADPVPVQPDLERPEVDLLEDDRLRRDRKRLIRPIDRDALKFIR